jgi:sugar porter (SP) family MFS transporter
MVQVYFACFIAFFNSAINGYDLSVFNNLATFQSFGQSFIGGPGFNLNSSDYALTSSMLQIGSIIGCFFVGLVSDNLGRRGGMITGSVIVILGVILELATSTIGVFITGRFLIGFGVVQVTTAAPTYCVEVAHPQFRARAGAIYNTGWNVGAVPASILLLAMSYVDAPNAPQAWQIPIGIQAVFSGIVLIGCFFIPESPRYMMSTGKEEEAKQFIIHYHGNDQEDHPIVEFTMREMRDALADESRQNQASYAALFTGRAMRYRSGLIVAIAFFSQYAGSWLASGFSVITNAQFGWSTPQSQLGVSIVTSIIGFIVSQFGAAYTDKLGRRTMLLYGTIGYTVCWLIILITLNSFNNDPTQTALGIFGWVMLQVFSIIYSFTWTPLNALYPVEILPYSARAKGMAMCQLFINAAGVIQGWVLVYGVNAWAWKFDAFYLVFNAFAAVVIYFTFVETKGYTLEKIDEIFEDPNPVKKSLSEVRTYVSAADKTDMTAYANKH